MTTQQDSVDVERLREAGRMAQRGADNVFHELNRDPDWRPTRADYTALGHLLHNIAGTTGNRAALSLPITQRDEQASRRAEAALSVAEMLVPFTTHNIGCAVYQRSYAGGSPVCTCGVEAGREAVTAIRRLSIEQGDQDGGEG